MCNLSREKLACKYNVLRLLVSHGNRSGNSLSIYFFFFFFGSDQLRRNLRANIMQTRTKYSYSRGFPRDSLPVVILYQTIPEARSCIIHASASVEGYSTQRNVKMSAGLDTPWLFVLLQAFKLSTRHDHSQVPVILYNSNL